MTSLNGGSVSSVNGGALSVQGSVPLLVCAVSFCARQKFLVANDISFDVILGAEFLKSQGALVDFTINRLILPGVVLPLIAASRQVSASTATPHDTNIDHPAPTASLPVTTPSQPRLKVSETVTVPAYHEIIIPLHVTPPSPLPADTSMLIEPLDSFIAKQPSLEVGTSISTAQNAVVSVINRSDSPITIYSETHLAVCDVLPNEDICAASSSDSAMSDEPELCSAPPSTAVVTAIDSYINQSCTHLTPADRSSLRALLLENHDVFAITSEQQGYCDVAPHTIDTGSHPPIRQPAYRVPYRHRTELQTLLSSLLHKGVIQPSSSPWASPVVLVPKKDGSLRLCVDYRKLNKVTVADAYPLPRVDDTLDAFAGCDTFTTLDMATGYWQIAMDATDQEKTAFTTPLGLYEFTVLPMGCCNGPATFQRLMQHVLADIIAASNPVCRVFFDDIGIGSSGIGHGLRGLASVFRQLRKYNLRLKLSKCAFLQTRTKFLGVDISGTGIHTSAAKVDAIVSWPTPTSAKDVRSFLGLAGYYRRFVPRFAHVSAPLTALTAKKTPFVWTPACSAAFRILKERLAGAPVLALPDYSATAAPFVLDTDASSFGMGAALSQRQEGEDRVICFGSILFNKAQRNYSATERELLAFVHFSRVFRYYLVGHPFTVRTDHAALKWLMTLKEPTGRRARWLEQLAELDFTVEHRPGRQHVNADALSRRAAAVVSNRSASSTAAPIPSSVTTVPSASPAVEAQPLSDIPSQSPMLFGVSLLESWMPRLPAAELLAAQKVDPEISIIFTWYNPDTQKFDLPSHEALAGCSPIVRRYAADSYNFCLHDNILYRNSTEHGLQLIVPTSLRDELLQSFHSDPGGGHFGAEKTLSSLKRRFYWPGMKGDVRTHILACAPCAISKSATTSKAPLQSVIAGYPNEIVAMDLVGPLPTTRHGNSYILVCQDYFTRWPAAFPLPNMTAATVANVFFLRWICTFGPPTQLHTDQGTQFESNLFAELCDLFNIHKTRTTAYHPQGDGLVERFNRTLVSSLRAYANTKPHSWDDYIEPTLLAYRTAVHSSSNFTPAKLMLGRELRLPAELVYGLPPDATFTSTAHYVVQLADALHTAFGRARETDRVAHKRQKDYYDYRTKTSQYAPGDRVWLAKPGILQKLESRWDGPFLVTSVLGPTTYTIRRTDDPDGRIQTVHYNRLKPCHAQTSAEVQPSVLPSLRDSVEQMAPPNSCVWPDADDQPVILAPAPAPAPPQPQQLQQPPALMNRQHLQRNAGLPVRLRNNFIVYR